MFHHYMSTLAVFLYQAAETVVIDAEDFRFICEMYSMHAICQMYSMHAICQMYSMHAKLVF
ncbi:hypothetical protein SEVIR_4G120630v4 [Setaria viridis]